MFKSRKGDEGNNHGRTNGFAGRIPADIGGNCVGQVPWPRESAESVSIEPSRQG